MTTLHAHIDIAGILANWSNRDIARLFGRPTREAAQIKQTLCEYLADGIKVLPIGGPCEGWSYATGCPGHETGGAA